MKYLLITFPLFLTGCATLGRIASGTGFDPSTERLIIDLQSLIAPGGIIATIITAILYVKELLARKKDSEDLELIKANVRDLRDAVSNDDIAAALDAIITLVESKDKYKELIKNEKQILKDQGLL